MGLKLSKLTFHLKVVVNGKTVKHTFTRSKGRFIQKLRRINWKNSPSVYCRVTYGEYLDVYGEKQKFINEGVYTTEKELNQAFRAFTEL